MMSVLQSTNQIKAGLAVCWQLWYLDIKHNSIWDYLKIILLSSFLFFFFPHEIRFAMSISVLQLSIYLFLSPILFLSPLSYLIHFQTSRTVTWTRKIT